MNWPSIWATSQVYNYKVVCQSSNFLLFLLVTKFSVLFFILGGFLCAKEKNIRMIYQSWLVQHSGEESNLVYPPHKKNSKTLGQNSQTSIYSGLSIPLFASSLHFYLVEEMRKSDFKVLCKQTLRKYFT